MAQSVVENLCRCVKQELAIHLDQKFGPCETKIGEEDSSSGRRRGRLKEEMRRPSGRLGGYHIMRQDRDILMRFSLLGLFLSLCNSFPSSGLRSSKTLVSVEQLVRYRTSRSLYLMHWTYLSSHSTAG